MFNVIEGINKSEWLDVNTLTTLPLGQTLQLINNGSTPLLVRVSEATPTLDETGVPLYVLGDSTTVSSPTNKVWIRSVGGFVKGKVIVLSGNDLSPVGVSSDVYNGNKGLTTQSFTEANVKNGVQYELSLYEEAFLGTTDTVVVTGPLPVIIKAQSYLFDGLGARTTIYKDPIYTGGTPVTYYNKNLYKPVLGESVILSGATISSEGTQGSAQQIHLGSEGVGNTVFSTSGQDAQGLETVLAPNTTYLFRRISLDSSAQKMFVYSTWYEGNLSSDKDTL